MDFSEFETARGGIWRICAVIDDATKDASPPPSPRRLAARMRSVASAGPYQISKIAQIGHTHCPMPDQVGTQSETSNEWVNFSDGVNFNETRARFIETGQFK